MKEMGIDVYKRQGRLAHYFDLPDEAWQKSLEVCVPSKFLELNKKAFQLGKNA